jgi:UDP-glucose 4-epimerase
VLNFVWIYGLGEYNYEMAILVTGGAGFIGSHLVEHLATKGEQIIVIDDFSSNNNFSLKDLKTNKLVKIVKGSILDQNLVEESMRAVTKCYHLAAALGVERINNDSLQSLEVNIKGTENVLKAASKFKVRTLTASSSEVYGRNPKMPLTEESDRVLGSPKIARWSYSEAKAIDEFYAFELYKKSSFEVTIARLFNTVGPGQSGIYGMVLPRFIKAALSNQALIVYGDGSQSRSFCAVSDVVEALDSLMNTSESIGQVYNVGSTNEILIKELAQKVIDITGSKSQIVFKKHSEIFGDNFEEPVRRVPDISKISKVIGWQPKKSLDTIILEVAEYIKANEV